jgi:hypothetical protein
METLPVVVIKWVGMGAMMGIWLPSTASMHCGNPHLLKKPSTITWASSPVGSLMYLLDRVRTMA